MVNLGKGLDKQTPKVPKIPCFRHSDSVEYFSHEGFFLLSDWILASEYQSELYMRVMREPQLKRRMINSSPSPYDISNLRKTEIFHVAL